jgi:hypothetical protein
MIRLEHIHNPELGDTRVDSQRGRTNISQTERLSVLAFYKFVTIMCCSTIKQNIVLYPCNKSCCIFTDC